MLVFNTALAQYWSQNTAIGRLFGPPIGAMAWTFFMATVGILPAGGSPAASSLQEVMLFLATPLVLLGVANDFQRKRPRQGLPSTSSQEAMVEMELEWDKAIPWYRFGFLRRRSRRRRSSSRTISAKSGVARTTEPLYLSFALAAMGTLVASTLAWLLLKRPLLVAMGEDNALKIAAALMARNIGGGLNYIAVCTSLQASPTAVAAGLCADNIWGLVYFPFISYLADGHVDPAVLESRTTTTTIKTETTTSKSDHSTPLVMSNIAIGDGQATTTTTTTNPGPVRGTNTSELATTAFSDMQEEDAVLSNGVVVLANNDDVATTAEAEEGKETTQDLDNSMTVERITVVLLTSSLLVWLGQLLGGPRGALPVCTALTVVFIKLAIMQPPRWIGKLDAITKHISWFIPNRRWIASIQPTAQIMGTVALHVFFSTLGAQGGRVMSSVQSSLVPLGGFLALIYTFHGLWLWMWHVLCPKHPSVSSVPRLLIASSAAIGGPATAVALAQSNSWNSLHVPGLLVGNIGDILGTFIGIAFFAVFSGTWLS